MLQGVINLFGVAFLLASVAAFLWRERVKQTVPASLSKDLWLRILLFIGIYVFFMGNAFWIDNPMWFRVNLIIAHVIMIPALYGISQMWWRLLVKEMPKWWGGIVIGLGVIFVLAETYYAFKGWLPSSYIIRDNITVMVRNDHPLVAWLFIPTVWSSFWPLGFVFFRQSFIAEGLKAKARLFSFGLAWIAGSSMSVYSNFSADPAKIYKGNLVLIAVFIILIVAILFKPKQAAIETGALPTGVG